MWFFNKNKSIPFHKEVEQIIGKQSMFTDKKEEDFPALAEALKSQSDSIEKKTEAFALLSEGIKRVLGFQIYPVQIAGGIALREGNIAQMRTGEGKTLTALFPAFWGYLCGEQTYIITVNEYLAERDYEQAKKVFDLFSIPVGLVLNGDSHLHKKEAYTNLIVYTTNSEFAFDYLRDNITPHVQNLLQKSFDRAIIDEADLVLVDEAKNPVIISGESNEMIEYVEKAYTFVEQLDEKFIEIDESNQLPLLTEEGYDEAQRYFGQELTDSHALFHSVRQGIMAKYRFKRDVDYIVRKNKIELVDKYTGRVLDGRRLQQGLHQAIEQKEGVPVLPENVAHAMTTYQNLFRKFKVLSGMTGTATESKREFEEVYHMSVLEIPTNNPVQRIDHDDVLYETKDEKYIEATKVVQEKQQLGQPVLIGTTSVQESEIIAGYLTKAKIPYHLLNAKNDETEADIIGQAGGKGVVTIATNMAGRGTDIQLQDGVEALGGLFVLGLSRNESKRIDRQLQGRSGRQGEKGESQFFTSLEDELLVEHGAETLEHFNKKNKKYPISDKKATELVDKMQLIVQSQQEEVRKLQLQLDEIIHYQRELVYGIRKDTLINGFELEKIKLVTKNLLEHSETPVEEIQNLFGLPLVENEKRDILTTRIFKELDTYMEKELSDSAKTFSSALLIEALDGTWIPYLQEMELFKHSFAFSVMGEQDPIRTFSMELDKIFQYHLRKSLKVFYVEWIRKMKIQQELEKIPFFTTFPTKPTYLFSVNTGETEQVEVVSTLLGEDGIVEVFRNTGNDSVLVVIPYQLPPGRYLLRHQVGEKETYMGFKVLREVGEHIWDTEDTITVILPIKEMYQVSAPEYEVFFLNNDTGHHFTFQIDTKSQHVQIEKPSNEKWVAGDYVLTISGMGLPLYHKEIRIRESQSQSA